MSQATRKETWALVTSLYTGVVPALASFTASTTAPHSIGHLLYTIVPNLHSPVGNYGRHFRALSPSRGVINMSNNSLVIGASMSEPLSTRCEWPRQKSCTSMKFVMR